MNNKRTGKFYRKNEDDVMKQLGLNPAGGSGAGLSAIEVGCNDTILCQLKSTDEEIINIKQKDLHTLLYNSIVSHKVPVFAIQFLNTDEVWIMAKSDDLIDVANGLQPYKQRKPWEGMEEWRDGKVIGHMDDPGPKGEPGYPGIPNPVIRSQPPKPLLPEDVEEGIAKYFHMRDEEKERFEMEVARRHVKSSMEEQGKIY